MMANFVEVASGLRFPEGPVALPDGSVVLVEMMGRCITRVMPDGTKQTVAKIAGGPNGMALGPDGALYLCNNGGSFSEQTINGLTYPGPFNPSLYIGGRIQRVDLNTGAVTDLYTHCDGHQLRGPNDIVFDRNGGMWFTDHGIRHERVFDLTGIYYAKTDGSMIREVIFPCQAPNGIGLSPDGETLYWAETFNGPVGCSRAVTNNGWRNHTDQVGQTGTRIAPDIYFACGISGAIQHWVGAMASKNILAINIDKEAYIVSKAAYAVIGDLHQVVPAISAELRRRRAL